ncbi:hypothetical protein GR198_03660 [Rhizobium leguminosarum]|uniref:hypothetical protein n=1 Tax=Rhizobium leguminosarum TaxID=384 RepID=UPI0013C07BEB|nr:hypothetical protein [Rhizobium leguminosarum]NEH54836.1 hypothetical protein [Rhizobium leguminosarum]
MQISEGNHQHIDLERTFHELSRQWDENDDGDLSKGLFVSDLLTWENLLAEYRVVILSEAGSGKTEEIRHTAWRLRKEGKDAFFLRLENIPSHFENAFDVGTLDEFNDWVLSGREGWLLLDSVDEARLRHPQDFELAVKIIGDRIRLALDRSHVVLTGRMSAWRPKTDLEMCRRNLPYTPIARVAEDAAGGPHDADENNVDSSDFDGVDGEQPERQSSRTSISEGADNPTAPFRIVTLDDLNAVQVERFATASGIAEVSEFVKAIERADAWQFTTRPQDLEDLIALWGEKRRIGGRLAIMQGGIFRRLKESDQNRDDAVPLSDQKARTGAQFLAAATTLGRNPAIQVPDGAHGLGGIHVDRVLPDWDARERKALLERPVFDAPAYGAVRFHHRNVREYLTAEWLHQLLKEGGPRQAIESMFFKTQYDTEIVVPATRPLLPWLALFDESIRERTIVVAPEILFEGGDPAELPLPTRRQVLRDVTSEIADNYTPRSPTALSAVQRFAHVDLTDDIRQLMQQYKSNSDALSFLLRMVWQGQIKGALPETLAAALTNDGNSHQRISAIRALNEIGSPVQLREVREALLNEGVPIKRDVLGELVATLGCTDKDIDWLLSAIANAEAPARFQVDRLSQALIRFVNDATKEALAVLAAGFDHMLSRAPYIDQRYLRVSEESMWLLQAAARTAERLIEARDPAALEAAVIRVLHAVGASRHFGSDVRELKTAMADLVPSWPDLNRAVFWSEVEVARIASGETSSVNSPWQVSRFGGFWKFDGKDFSYLCEQITEKSSVDDKLIALSLAYDAYVLSGSPRDIYETLKRAVSDEDKELTRRFLSLLNPPPRSQLAPQEARWKRRASARERAEGAEKRKAKEYIRNHIESLRDPKFPNPEDVSRTQWYLYHQTRDAAERSGKWSVGAWEILIPTFGEEVAHAYRDGALAFWRRALPKLRSEGAPANQTVASVIFGLTGLAIEAREINNWCSGLNEDDVLRACRYATHELNGFPEWFPGLFEAYPTIVADFLMRELAFEVRHEPEDGMHYIVDDLSWSGRWAWADLGPKVLELLKTVEPRNSETLDKLLQIVIGSPVSVSEIAELAKSRATSGLHPPHVAHWFAAWTGASPKSAITAFEQYLSSVHDDQLRTETAMTFVTRLFGERRTDPTIAHDAFKTPEHLKSLYKLAHQHIRRSEDIDRANGGVYSPTLRDHAQDARNAILNVLEAIPGEQSYRAMKELALADEQPSGRWISYRAQRRAEQDGDLPSWSPEQVRALALL